MPSLADQAQDFAVRLSATLNAVLPGDNTVEATQGSDDSRYLIQPVNSQNLLRRLPLFVAGEHLADLTVQIYLELDVLAEPTGDACSFVPL